MDIPQVSEQPLLLAYNFSVSIVFGDQLSISVEIFSR